MRFTHGALGLAVTLLAAGLVAGCHPATAAVAADACAAPTPWQPPGAKPGKPDAEFAQCLQDAAYAARGVSVPDDSKAAGVIAQCRVEVDRFEGVFASADESGSDAQRQAGEAKAQQLARAAIDQYRSCPGR